MFGDSSNWKLTIGSSCEQPCFNELLDVLWEKRRTNPFVSNHPRHIHIPEFVYQLSGDSTVSNDQHCPGIRQFVLEKANSYLIVSIFPCPTFSSLALSVSLRKTNRGSELSSLWSFGRDPVAMHSLSYWIFSWLLSTSSCFLEFQLTTTSIKKRNLVSRNSSACSFSFTSNFSPCCPTCDTGLCRNSEQNILFCNFRLIWQRLMVRSG